MHGRKNFGNFSPKGQIQSAEEALSLETLSGPIFLGTIAHFTKTNSQGGVLAINVILTKMPQIG
jgi:hypothetical protein